MLVQSRVRIACEVKGVRLSSVGGGHSTAVHTWYRPAGVASTVVCVPLGEFNGREEPRVIGKGPILNHSSFRSTIKEGIAGCSYSMASHRRSSWGSSGRWENCTDFHLFDETREWYGCEPRRSVRIHTPGSSDSPYISHCKHVQDNGDVVVV